MRTISILFMMLILAACSTHPVMVSKPIAVSCIPNDVLIKPNYPDSKQNLLNAKSPAERYKLLFAGRSVRIDRIAALETVVKDCSN